ncbi:hypothetical protein NKH18_18545 [Streptomyces sp. M10(2022)]
MYGALGGLLPPGKYSVNRLPGASVLGGQNLAVTADSSRADDARALISFLTSRESERCLLDAGFAATGPPPTATRPCAAGPGRRRPTAGR